MKKILFLTSAVAMLASSGCVVSEGRYHEHRYRHEEIIEGPRVIVAPPPPVVVRPEIIVR